MSKKDPLDPKNVTTTRFEISQDELEARMERQRKMHDEPVSRAVALLHEALTQVLTKLGVDCTQDRDNIAMQQQDLGITIWEHTDDRSPQINGFFIHIGGGDFIPYAWVGSARLDTGGNVWCDIQYFQEGKMESLGGIKVVS